MTTRKAKLPEARLKRTATRDINEHSNIYSASDPLHIPPEERT